MREKFLAFISIISMERHERDASSVLAHDAYRLPYGCCIAACFGPPARRTPSQRMHWHVGIDENGLGPQLGPLVVTAVMARLTPEANARIARFPKDFLHQRLGDSKQLVAHQHVDLAESWARVLDASMYPDKAPAMCPKHVVGRLLLGGESQLRSHCPASAVDQCWSCFDAAFHASSAQLQLAHNDLQHMQEQGIQVLWMRSSITCVREFHVAKSRGVSRLDLDLHAMEELLIAARAYATGPLQACCGKVGSMQRYVPKFATLGRYPITTIEQTRGDSVYDVGGVGRVHFLLHGEARDPLLARASLVGKWVREQFMDAIVNFYQRLDSSVSRASGYNDPVTRKFVEATSKQRQRMGIPATCFARPGATDLTDLKDLKKAPLQTTLKL